MIYLPSSLLEADAHERVLSLCRSALDSPSRDASQQFVPPVIAIGADGVRMIISQEMLGRAGCGWTLHWIPTAEAIAAYREKMGPLFVVPQPAAATSA